MLEQLTGEGNESRRESGRRRRRTKPEAKAEKEEVVCTFVSQLALADVNPWNGLIATLLQD